jgi:hypothetical protein
MRGSSADAGEGKMTGACVTSVSYDSPGTKIRKLKLGLCERSNISENFLTFIGYSYHSYA